MARERMVTRTVSMSVATVICMDITTAEVRKICVKMGGGVTEEKEILKHARKIHETATFKIVAVESVETQEIIYGMPEAQFILLATPMDKR